MDMNVTSLFKYEGKVTFITNGLDRKQLIESLKGMLDGAAEGIDDFDNDELDSLAESVVYADMAEHLDDWGGSLEELIANFPSEEEVEEIQKTEHFPFYLVEAEDGTQIWYDGI